MLTPGRLLGLDTSRFDPSYICVFFYFRWYTMYILKTVYLSILYIGMRETSMDHCIWSSFSFMLKHNLDFRQFIITCINNCICCIPANLYTNEDYFKPSYSEYLYNHKNKCIYCIPVKLYTNEDNFIPYSLVYLGISKITVYIVYLYACISCVS